MDQRNPEELETQMVTKDYLKNEIINSYKKEMESIGWYIMEMPCPMLPPNEDEIQHTYNFEEEGMHKITRLNFLEGKKLWVKKRGDNIYKIVCQHNNGLRAICKVKKPAMDKIEGEKKTIKEELRRKEKVELNLWDFYYGR